jgi:hypothetical protein
MDQFHKDFGFFEDIGSFYIPDDLLAALMEQRKVTCEQMKIVNYIICV